MRQMFPWGMLSSLINVKGNGCKVTVSNPPPPPLTVTLRMGRKHERQAACSVTRWHPFPASVPSISAVAAWQGHHSPVGGDDRALSLRGALIAHVLMPNEDTDPNVLLMCSSLIQSIYTQLWCISCLMLSPVFG